MDPDPVMDFDEPQPITNLQGKWLPQNLNVNLHPFELEYESVSEVPELLKLLVWYSIKGQYPVNEMKESIE